MGYPTPDTVAAAAHLAAQIAREFPNTDAEVIAYAAAEEVMNFQYGAPLARSVIATYQ
jgi:hypothetical protein